MSKLCSDGKWVHFKNNVLAKEGCWEKVLPSEISCIDVRNKRILVACKNGLLFEFDCRGI